MHNEPGLWSALRVFMERECGVVLSADQQYLLEPRLEPVARAFSLSLGDVISRAASGPRDHPLRLAVVDAMTTHESLFFRDAGFWKNLEDVILPDLIATRGPRLKIWSAACSHGQEPYSLAMLLEERWPDVAAQTQIVATDISAVAVARAATGLFSTLEVNRGLGARRLVQHFTLEGGAYRVKEKLRSRIEWQTHNLVGGAADPTRCDIVLCRNVLIYFAEHDRRLVLQRLERAVHPRGYVGVGATEIIHRGSLSPGWHLVDARSAPDLKQAQPPTMERR